MGEGGKPLNLSDSNFNHFAALAVSYITDFKHNQVTPPLFFGF